MVKYACIASKYCSADALTPQTTSVTANPAQMLSLELDAPLPAGAVTRITYTSASGCQWETAEFVTHPGKVDGNATSNARDILALIDCCLNRVCDPPLDGYRCDVNRSGTTDGKDILRLIDLVIPSGSVIMAESPRLGLGVLVTRPRGLKPTTRE